MPLVGQNFVYLSTPTLVGSTMQAAGSIASYTGKPPFDRIAGPAQEAAAAPGNALLDLVEVDFSVDPYAKHGSALVNLTGTTPVTLNLTALATNAASQAGDTSFAAWNTIVLNNLGTTNLTVSPAATNPLALPLGGSSPTLTVPAGSSIVLSNAAGYAISGTANAITITPTAGGQIALSIAGS